MKTSASPREADTLDDDDDEVEECEVCEEEVEANWFECAEESVGTGGIGNNTESTCDDAPSRS